MSQASPSLASDPGLEKGSHKRRDNKGSSPCGGDLEGLCVKGGHRDPLQNDVLRRKHKQQLVQESKKQRV